LIFHPTRLSKSSTATSLISGEVRRNDIVIPTGIPAEMKPRNTGILEQEQKGVIAPNVDLMK